MTAFEWAIASEPQEPPSDFYCQTRDMAQGRADKLKLLLLRMGWTEDQAGLITSIAGELANNCFDHNIGTWKDIPGCWFEYKIEPNFVSAIVADRGQGILNSLRYVRPHLKDDNEALRVAFTEQISGRAPENRGNGLKHVVRSLNQLPASRLEFTSGNAKLVFIAPLDPTELARYIIPTKESIPGMFALLYVPK